MSDNKILVGDMSRKQCLEVLKRLLEAMETFDGISPSPERINALKMAISSLETDETYQLEYESTTKNDLGVDCISRKAVQTRLKEIINEMETIFADIREREVNDSVCGLCEYDCEHGLDGYANECPGFEKDDCFKLNEKYKAEWLDISNIPSVTPIRPKGHWIVEKTRSYLMRNGCCSNCKDFYTNDWKEMNYCPNCGARMEEVEE